MPYRLNWEAHGVVRHYHGDVTIAERLASFEAICGDARFDSLRWCITDYLAVQHYEVTAEATAEIAAYHRAPHLTNPRVRLAAVAVRPDVVAAIRDFIALRLAPQPYEVFATMADARRWVGARAGAGG